MNSEQQTSWESVRLLDTFDQFAEKVAEDLRKSYYEYTYGIESVGNLAPSRDMGQWRAMAVAALKSVWFFDE